MSASDVGDAAQAEASAFGRVVAWSECGPRTATGFLWEVSVERCPVEAPWSLYIAYQGAHDGELDLNEMQRCVDAGRTGERELARLTDPVRWMRGEVAARNPAIALSPKKVAAFIEKHAVRCVARGCSMFGLFHPPDGDGHVRHLAMRAAGRGWELEVATEPACDEWFALTRDGRRVTGEDRGDFAAALESALSHARRLNGGAEYREVIPGS